MAQFSITQVATAIFLAGSASATTSWYLRGDQIDGLKERINTYEVVQSLNLKSLAASAQKANEELAERLHKFNETEALRDEILNLKKALKDKDSRINGLVADLDTKSKEISVFKARLSDFISDNVRFDLEESQIRRFLSDKYTVSLINLYNRDIDVFINNERKSLSIGQYIEMSDNGNQCKLTLEGINYEKSATFDFSCSK